MSEGRVDFTEKESRIRGILEKIPEDAKIGITNDILGKIIVSIIENASKHVDGIKCFKSWEEAGKKAGENFAKETISRYGIKVEDAPSAMQIMNIASFFDETPYKILKSTRKEVVKQVEGCLLVPSAGKVSADAESAVLLFVKGYCRGAANVMEERFGIKIEEGSIEGKKTCTITLTGPHGNEKEKIMEIPEEIKKMDRAARLNEKKKYLAVVIAHLALALNECLGFENASGIVKEAVHPIGLEAGKTTKEKFGLGESAEDVYLIHYISPYMMGIKTESVKMDGESIIYTHSVCPFGPIASMVIDYMNIIDARKRVDARFIICEVCKGFASGLTHAVSKEWETYSPKRLSAGDPYCLFLLSRGGGGGEINLSSY